MRCSTVRSSAITVTCVFLSLVTVARTRTTLDPAGIYGSTENAKACLALTFSVISAVFIDHGEQLPDVAANCLRFAFHDAGTYLVATDEGGANGSLMLEPERSTLQGALCPWAMEDAVRQARETEVCQNLTYADAIQVAGSVAISLLSKGSVTCNMLMGRPDSGKPDSAASLPQPCHNAVALTAMFANMGFADPETAVVVLSGAHDIGVSRATGMERCNNTEGFSVGTQQVRRIAAAPLTITSTVFDGQYYQEVVKQRGVKGLLQSDRALNNKTAGATTVQRQLMSKFAGQRTAFFSKWCPFYREMSMLGVDTVTLAGLKSTKGWSPVEKGSLNVKYR